MRFGAMALGMLLAMPVCAQDITVRLTHDDPDGVVLVGETVNYSLTIRFPGWGDNVDEWYQVAASINARIVTGDTGRVLSSPFVIDNFAFIGVKGGEPDGIGGITDFTFLNSLFYEAFYHGYVDRSNPLVVGSFQVTPVCPGELRYSIRQGNFDITAWPDTEKISFVSLGINAFADAYFAFDEVSTETDPLYIVPSNAAYDLLKIGPIEDFGIVDGIRVFERLPNGELVAAGSFGSVGGVEANNIARWDGEKWSPFAAGLDGEIMALKVLANGDLLAGGQFFGSGDEPMPSIARWDGQQWNSVGTGLMGTVTAIELGLSDEIIVGMNTFYINPVKQHHRRGYVSMFDGNSWNTMGSESGLGMNGVVRALQTLPDGKIVAGGEFGFVDGDETGPVVRWDGVQWQPMGDMSRAIEQFTLDSNGQLLAASSRGVHRWDGQDWNGIVGTDYEVSAMQALADGGVVIAGTFTTVNGIWSPGIAVIQGGVVERSIEIESASIEALMVSEGKEIIAIGEFTPSGSSSPQSGLAQLTRVDQAQQCCLVIDFNGSGTIEQADILPFLDLFLARDPAADLNHDGTIDMGDIEYFLEVYQSGCAG